MSGVQLSPSPDAALASAVLDHLARQIESGRRLLSTVLAQGVAIRAREVEQVLEQLAQLKAEMTERGALEGERSVLLERAGAALGVPAAAVTLDAMTTLMPPAAAARARELSAELQGLIAEVAREHGVNRALMRQELAFLDHLVRLLGGEPDGGYSPAGAGSEPPRRSHHVLNVQA